MSRESDEERTYFCSWIVNTPTGTNYSRNAITQIRGTLPSLAKIEEAMKEMLIKKGVTVRSLVVTAFYESSLCDALFAHCGYLFLDHDDTQGLPRVTMYTEKPSLL